MYRTLTKIGLLVFILLTFVLCRKKYDPLPRGFSCDNITKTPITDPVQLSCKFKEGSYWVFRDEKTNSIDTAKIYNTGSKYGFEPTFSEGCDSIEYFSSAYLLSNKCSFFLDLMPKSLWVMGTGYKQFYTTDQNSRTPSIIIDSLQVSGTWYKKVYESDIIVIRSAKDDIKADLFFRPDVGLIRIDLFDLNNNLTSKKLVISKHIIL